MTRILHAMSFVICLMASFLFAGVGLAEEQSSLKHEGIVDAPVRDVWEAFTTKEGIQTWMAAHAQIELRVGGKMQTHYDPKGKIGDAGTIENTILSYDPLRMFSMRATKPPATFPFKKAIQEMWTVIYFTPVNDHQTKIEVVCHGFTADPESVKMRKFFDAGNAWTVQKLQQKFSKSPAKPAERKKPG